MASTRNSAFGDQLKRYRLAAGLTQEQLAARAGLSARGISDLERGLKVRPRRDTVTLLADALQLARPQRTWLEAAARGQLTSPREFAAAEPTTGEQVSGGSPVGRESSAPIRHNLPGQLTSFVGREQACAEVEHLLRSNRLLTLTGSGGCGKTRLALRIGGDLVEDHPDGVWLVELASLGAAELVPRAVADVLALREAPDQPILETILRDARDKRLMFVLDNCEHLIDACARFAEAVLAACPRVRILTTSREVLRIAGEVVFWVPSLATPPPGAVAVAEDLVGYGATRLFVDRARAGVPNFNVDESSVPSIVQICERLDGIPLAIELAAARVAVLNVRQIAARLDDRFRLLTRGSRTALPRQQTLRASIDWSYSLLTDLERVVFRRLAVFVGGWSLEAAEAVCRSAPPSDEGEPPPTLARDPTTGPFRATLQDVLPGLLQLAEKSLVIADHRWGETRFQLLETMRAYALERLAESGEQEQIERAHATWFVGFAEDAMRELRGPKRPGWTTRLEREQGNLRAALEWATATADAPIGLRLGAALWRFWINRGAYAEGRAHLARLLALPGGAQPTAERANALTAAGVLAREQGDLAAARAQHEEALAIHRQLADVPGIAASLNTLGLVAERQGDFAAACALYEDTLRLSREHGDQPLIAYALGNLGMMATNQGDYERASVLIEECLAICRAIHDTSGIANSALELGRIAAALGNVELARARFAEGFALMDEIGDQTAVAYAFRPLATVLAGHGERERALVLWGAYAAWRQLAGVELLPAELTSLNAEIAAARDVLGALATSAWAMGQAMTLTQAAAYALAESS